MFSPLKVNFKLHFMIRTFGAVGTCLTSNFDQIDFEQVSIYSMEREEKRWRKKMQAHTLIGGRKRAIKCHPLKILSTIDDPSPPADLAVSKELIVHSPRRNANGSINEHVPVVDPGYYI